MASSVESEIMEIALRFMESTEIAEHMRKDKSWFDGWGRLMRASSIITGSRASLEDKLAALRLIAQKYAEIESESGSAQNISDDNANEAALELDKLIEAAEFMLHETTENAPTGTVFLLKSSYLTKDDLTTTDDWEDIVPFASFNAAKSRLLREEQMFRENYGEAIDYKSYTISKWVHTQDDAMRRVITWYLSSEGLIWFADINDHFDERLKQLADDGRDLDDLNHELSWLTVPYLPGDIVTIDCRPTHEISHAVIAEIHDGGQDCCGIQAIYMTKGGELQQFALKHDINAGRNSLFTCMYRLEKYMGELPSWEAPLKKVSGMLKSDPSLGVENAEGDFFSRTGFRHNIKNYLPDHLDAGDVVRIRGLCDDCGETGPDYYAVIVDRHSLADDVTILFYHCDHYRDYGRLYKASLRHELGSMSRYSFTQCEEDLPGKYRPLIALGEAIKDNPSIADDEVYIERIHRELNRKVYRTQELSETKREENL